MSEAYLGYSDINSPVHRLSGTTKLIFLLFWSLTSMLTYDTRVLLFMCIAGVIIFKISNVEFKTVSFVFYIILFFLAINNLAIFIFSPYEGVSIYGTRHDLLHIVGPYTLTLEQLFYHINITLKYFSIIPIALLFIVATNPSEFAASLNKIGVSYRIAYSVSIALRYIPDVQNDYREISFSQQARGLEMSKKENIFKRIKNSASILMPLVFSSLERIETISAAMELRAFGNNKKRTWYNGKPFVKRDYMVMISVVILFIISILITINNGSRFYNPFI